MTRNTTDKLRRRVSYRWERRPPVMSPCGGTTWRRKNVALSLVLTQASNLSPCGTEQRSRAEPVRKFRSAHAAKEQSAVTSTTSNMLLSIPFWTTFGPPSPSRSLLKTYSNLCRQLYVWVSKSAVWNVGPWMDWYLLWLWLDIYCVYVLIDVELHLYVRGVVRLNLWRQRNANLWRQRNANLASPIWRPSVPLYNTVY